MQDLMTADPQIMLAKPVVRGTGSPLEHILKELGHGRTVHELVDGHHRLTREGVEAAFEALRTQRIVAATG